MNAEQVQQLLGLLVNAGLAMSTLVVFLIARYLVYKSRVRGADVEVRMEEGGRMVIAISNSLTVPIFVTGLIWNVGVLFKSKLLWEHISKENSSLEVPAGGRAQFVLQGKELKGVSQTILHSLGVWPAFFAERSIEVGLCIVGRQDVRYHSIARPTAHALLEGARPHPEATRSS